MTVTPNGMLLVATDVAAQDEADFNQWYDREHVEERVRIPGFLAGTRYQALQGGRKYLGLYKTTSLDCFTSPSYQAAFSHQTAWSQTNLLRMRDPLRRVCAIVAVTGCGTGSHLSLLSLAPAEEGALIERIAHLGESLSEVAGFVSSSLLLPDAALSTPLPNASPEPSALVPLLVLESSSAAAGERMAALAAQALSVSSHDVLHYALSWQLTAQELK
ncbi:hypothetical protein AU506_13795 [Lonsdalea populi]|uniref:DUF4286 family protein n=2 Tax=Lonsdalea populi TaxID=1172565 RepID=UPI000A243E20|nr:DUF4286 family protein [Lonsdalea populi]OSM94877.1 hypothetical protein AU508_13075 [Lonsdalea populi]RAT69502.1 hypothetical protein AU505_13705 [Lonsdalea populi]RAT73672.1 hypothetical protein AU506_13795 [Lonsdalea populi]RAT79171.1 hypothetical protein AU507_05040 [Lonsdalea populi]